MFRPVLISALLMTLALTNAHAAPSDSLKLQDNRLFVPVTINGFTTEALLDSAAEITFIDPKLAAELKLRPEGSETAKGSGGSTQVGSSGIRPQREGCHRWRTLRSGPLAGSSQL